MLRTPDKNSFDQVQNPRKTILTMLRTRDNIIRPSAKPQKNNSDNVKNTGHTLFEQVQIPRKTILTSQKHENTHIRTIAEPQKNNCDKSKTRVRHHSNKFRTLEKQF